MAVKIVTHDRTLATLAETLRESALSTSIQHPNVVRSPALQWASMSQSGLFRLSLRLS